MLNQESTKTLKKVRSPVYVSVANIAMSLASLWIKYYCIYFIIVMLIIMITSLIYISITFVSIYKSKP